MTLLSAARVYVRSCPLELTAVLVLVGLDVIDFGGVFSWLGLLADVTVFCGLLTLLARPVMGAVLMGVGLGAVSLVPAQHVGMGPFIPVIAVAHLVARSRVQLEWVVAASGWACGLWSSRRASGVRAWVFATGLWTLLYASAWVMGRVGARRRREVDGRLASALEHQRLQVAGELHDNLAHELSLIVMRAHQAQLHPEDAARELAFIADTAAQANGYLRNLMGLLRPGEPVRPVSLPAALVRAEQDLQVAGLTESVEVEGDPARVPPPVSDAVARVVKEAVNNMVRHASRDVPCSVIVVVTPGLVSVGFSNGWSGQEGRGLGLTGMRERVEGLGGTFQVGASGGVWRVRASVPWRVAR